MNPFSDPEQRQHTLTKVEAYEPGEYEIGFGSCWVTVITSPDIEPKVGDTVTFWGPEFGARRGFAINGQVVEYRTREQQEAWWRQQQEQQEQQQREEYEAKIDDHNRRIANLPDEFQQRFKEFRACSPDWGWRHERYELYTCEEAARLAEHFQTGDAIREFANLDYDEQSKLYEAGADHSGNTWGHAIRMAIVYLENPELVAEMHATICPLLGCKASGCHAARITGEVEI